MKHTLTLITAMPLASLNAADPKPAKPNFVVILIDDMGYGDIGPFGSKVDRTPNLDRMAPSILRCVRARSFRGSPQTVTMAIGSRRWTEA